MDLTAAQGIEGAVGIRNHLNADGLDLGFILGPYHIVGVLLHDQLIVVLINQDVRTAGVDLVVVVRALGDRGGIAIGDVGGRVVSGYVIGVDLLHLLLAQDGSGVVAKEVKHLGEGALGSDLHHLILATGVVHLILTGYQLGNRGVQCIAEGLQNGTAGGGLHGVLQLGEVGHDLHGVDVLMEGVGGVVGNRILVLSPVQGKDHILAAHEHTAVHSLLVAVHHGEVDVIAQDEVELLIPFGHGVVTGQSTVGGDLHLVVEVYQTGIHVVVGHVSGVLIGLDGVGGGIVILNLPQVQRIGVPLGFIHKVKQLKGLCPGRIDTHGLAVHHFLVVGFYLGAHIQGGDIGLVDQNLLDLCVQGDGLLICQSSCFLDQFIQTVIMDVMAQV